mgnify:CR=1 FL=1
MVHDALVMTHQMLILDARLARPIPLPLAREIVQDLVRTLLSDLQMQELGALEFFPAVDLRAPGWSFIQPITTSHISGHYFDSPASVFIDIYSCQPFDNATVVQRVHEALALGKWVATLVKRDTDPGQRTTEEFSGSGGQIVRP